MGGSGTTFSIVAAAPFRSEPHPDRRNCRNSLHLPKLADSGQNGVVLARGADRDVRIAARSGGGPTGGIWTLTRTQNVLLIIIDQLRADCLTGALAEHVNMPGIRELMAESVTFLQHFSVTSPCGPARASILTGQYAMNHRSVRNGTPLRHDTPTLATEMCQAGYRPLLFGYTDTSRDPRVHAPDDPAMRTCEYPMAGFHEILEMRFEDSHAWQSYLRQRGYEFEDLQTLYRPIPVSGGRPRINDPALYRAEDSDTAFLTNGFVHAIADHFQENWFAHLTYIRPHPPLVAPSPYNDMYDPRALPLPQRLETPEAEAALHPFFAPALRYKTPERLVEGFPRLAASDEIVQTMRAVYLGLATEVDHHVGRVVRFLKEHGQYDNTMILLTADHGELLGDHHAWGKMTVYDAAYHVPLIIRVPDNEAQAGTRLRMPTESIDITPTILDWVGTRAPNSMDGRSLLPLLKGDVPADWRDCTFSELDFSELEHSSPWEQALGTGPSTSCLGILRNKRFTLVEFAADLPPLLFDRNGRGEFENVAGKPEFAADLAHLTRAMLRHRMCNMDHTLSLDTITKAGPRSRVRFA